MDNWDGYGSGYPGHWRFEWNLNLIYTNPSNRHVTAEPYMSPATSGGIYAIRRDWWHRLGLFDAGMVGWGGDHLEATAKVWRCGGHIEIVTCSRVGHLFRDPKHRPYDVDVEQVVTNYARFADVWLDEYKSYFFKVKPDARKMKIGNTSGPKKVRSNLKCHNMSWFLEHVEREMDFEKDHICVPGCNHQQESICCPHEGAKGRSTVEQGGEIQPSQYIQLPPPEDFQHLDVDLSEFEL
eukprot:6474822-Amphidinium_carterae.2